MFLAAQKEPPKVFNKMSNAFWAHLWEPFARLLLDFRVPLFSFSRGGGREAFRHPFVRFWSYFFMICVKSEVLPAWELVFS